jgi:probable F420-dependent oxidoreductase
MKASRPPNSHRASRFRRPIRTGSVIRLAASSKSGISRGRRCVQRPRTSCSWSANNATSWGVTVKLQVVLPNESVDSDPAQLVELGVLAETLGYHTLWLPDHLLPPADYGDTYGGVYEPLVTLSYLAARTSSVLLGTSVLVLPMRNPFVVAKQVATVDRLSGGRITLGVGIGWDRTEFSSVGADYACRASKMDEAIELIRHLFETGSGPFHGRHFGFDTGVFAPRPVSGARLPIMVGGTSDAALRRAARLADSWQAVGLSPSEFAEHAARLRSLTTRTVQAGARISVPSMEKLDEALREVEQWRSAGAEHLAVWFGAVDGFAERMTRFAEAAADRGLMHGEPVR